MKTSLRAIAILFALGFGALTETASAADPIRFTVTGTANDSVYGYTAGLSYSFYWDLNNAFAYTWEQTIFNTTRNFWGDDHVSNTPPFVSMGGSGLIGAWQRPTVSEWDPFSFVDVRSGTTQTLSLYAGNDFWYPCGLQLGGKGVVVMEALYLNVGDIFSFPGSYTDPAVYFSALQGSYKVNAGTMGVYPLNDSVGAQFTATELTIGVIPEPATMLLVIVGGGAALFASRRNRRDKVLP